MDGAAAGRPAAARVRRRHRQRLPVRPHRRGLPAGDLHVLLQRADPHAVRGQGARHQLRLQALPAADLRPHRAAERGLVHRRRADHPGHPARLRDPPVRRRLLPAHAGRVDAQLARRSSSRSCARWSQLRGELQAARSRSSIAALNAEPRRERRTGDGSLAGDRRVAPSREPLDPPPRPARHAAAPRRRRGGARSAPRRRRGRRRRSAATSAVRRGADRRRPSPRRPSRQPRGRRDRRRRRRPIVKTTLVADARRGLVRRRRADGAAPAEGARVRPRPDRRPVRRRSPEPPCGRSRSSCCRRRATRPPGEVTNEMWQRMQDPLVVVPRRPDAPTRQPHRDLPARAGRRSSSTTTSRR